MTEPRITVAVPVRDRRDQMLRCLDALLALDHDSFEVLVLDNESVDGTAEACMGRAAGSPVEVRVERVPGAVGRVRNRGAELARGDLVAFTDSDCMPEPGWLRAAEAELSGAARVGVVQGPTLPEEGMELRPWCVTQNLPEWTGRFECCNLVVRREALINSAGFDEHVFFGEDTAGGFAILEAGWEAAFAPGAVVRHDVTYPGYRYWLRRGLKYGNFARIVRDHPRIRRDLLWGRIFLRPRSLKLIAALAGAGLSARAPIALLATLPYLAERTPRGRNPLKLGRDLAQGALFDLCVLAGCVRGSIRYRSLLL